MTEYSKIMECGFLSEEIEKWSKRIRDAHLDYFELCESFNRLSHEIAFEISPHNKNIKELLISALFLRNLTSYQGFIILAERGLISESRMLLRCLMEATFTLCALAKNDDLIKIYIQQK